MNTALWLLIVIAVWLIGFLYASKHAGTQKWSRIFLGLATIAPIAAIVGGSGMKMKTLWVPGVVLLLIFIFIWLVILFYAPKQPQPQDESDEYEEEELPG